MLKGVTRWQECREIENVECLLCEEGLYLFKLYSVGHLMDTTAVWIGKWRHKTSHNTYNTHNTHRINFFLDRLTLPPPPPRINLLDPRTKTLPRHLHPPQPPNRHNLPIHPRSYWPRYFVHPPHFFPGYG